MQKSLLLALCCSCCLAAVSGQSPWSLVHQSTTGNFYGLYAVNKDKIVASSEWGRLYQSIDGGQTLQLYQLPGNFSILNDIVFLNPQQGLIGGGCYFVTDDCLENVIASTNDGGLNWAVEKVADGLGVFSHLSTLPDGTVYAMSDYTGLFRRPAQSLSWDSLGRPGDFLSGGYEGMQFFDLNNGVVEHWGWMDGQSVNHLLRTQDGGQTWDLVFTSSFGSNPQHFFINAQQGFQFNATGQLGRTTDGGLNWTTEQVVGQLEEIQKIDFVTPSVGYLSTWQAEPPAGRIYRTSDGGDSWLLDFQADSVFWNDFHFADPQNGYAIGNWNQIFKRVGTVSATEPTPEARLTISPNPGHDFATVTLPEERSYSTLTIFDLPGRAIQRIALTAGQREVDIALGTLAPGVYLLAPQGRLGEAVKFVVRR